MVIMPAVIVAIVAVIMIIARPAPAMIVIAMIMILVLRDSGGRRHHQGQGRKQSQCKQMSFHVVSLLAPKGESASRYGSACRVEETSLVS